MIKLSKINAGRIGRFFTESSPQRIFVVVLFAVSIISVLWAALARVDVVVRAEGRIIPAGKSQIIQHLEGGIVKKIMVKEGQVVTAGEPLMELSDIQARSNLGQDESRLAALRGREARLIAEVNGRKAINFPKDLNDEDVIRVETAAWQARRSRLNEEIQALRARSSQKRSEISEITSKRQNLAGELELAQKQLKLMEKLRRNNAASELEVLENQSRVQRLKSQIAEATASIPRLEAARAEAESQMNEAAARSRAEASSALTQVREDLEKIKYGVDSNMDRLDRNIVRAPTSGFINKINIATIGGVVRPSEALMEITPDDQRIVIETRADPNDRANLRPSLPARVRIGAYDYATFGMLDGYVTEVSADSISDEKGWRFYRVNVEIDGSSASKSIRQYGALIPGMTASADIIVGKRTILSYLLSPIFKFKDGLFRGR